MLGFLRFRPPEDTTESRSGSALLQVMSNTIGFAGFHRRWGGKIELHACTQAIALKEEEQSLMEGWGGCEESNPDDK